MVREDLSEGWPCSCDLKDANGPVMSRGKKGFPAGEQ